MKRTHICKHWEFEAGGAVWDVRYMGVPGGAGPGIYRASTDHPHYIAHGPRALVGHTLHEITDQLRELEADYRDTIG